MRLLWEGVENRILVFNYCDSGKREENGKVHFARTRSTISVDYFNREENLGNNGGEFGDSSADCLNKRAHVLNAVRQGYIKTTIMIRSNRQSIRRWTGAISQSESHTNRGLVSSSGSEVPTGWQLSHREIDWSNVIGVQELLKLRELNSSETWPTTQLNLVCESNQQNLRQHLR